MIIFADEIFTMMCRCTNTCGRIMSLLDNRVEARIEKSMWEGFIKVLFIYVYSSYKKPSDKNRLNKVSGNIVHTDVHLKVSAESRYYSQGYVPTAGVTYLEPGPRTYR